MSSLSKAQLQTENSTSFPNNTTGYITPAALRNFNSDMIDSNVNQDVYTTDSASFQSQINSLQNFSSSLSIDYINQTELNAATASLSASLTTTINTKVSNTTFNTFSASVTSSIINLQNGKANLSGDNSFTGSQYIDGNITASGNVFAVNITSSNNIKAVGISGSGLGIQGSSVLGGNASDVQTLKGTVYIPNTLIVGGVNFNDISASLVSASYWITTTFPPYSQSVAYRLNALEVWSSSLDTNYATDAQLAAVSTSLQTSINNLSSSNYFINTTQSADIVSVSASVYSVSASVFSTNVTQSNQINSLISKTGSYATTGSNTFVGTQYIGSQAAGGELIVGGNIGSGEYGHYFNEIAGGASGNYTNYSSQSSAINIGAVDFNAGAWDTELYVEATPSQIRFQDFNGFGYNTWLTLVANNGSNLSPIFNRGLRVTGSTEINANSDVATALRIVTGSFAVTSKSGSFYTNLPMTSSGARINGKLRAEEFRVAVDFNQGNGNLYVEGNTYLTGSLIVSKSVAGIVNVLTASAQTASLDCSLGNFFTLNIPTSSTTFVNATNVQPGQTVAIQINQAASNGGSLAFSSAFKFPTGSAYTGSTTPSAVDVLTFVSFNNTTLYCSVAKNLV